jgi:NAD(P)H-flavin reductase
MLQADSDLGHRAGQYVTLLREDGLARSYSIASATGDRLLELHVRVLSDGRMSRWLPEAAGAAVRLRGPAGECFYAPLDLDQPLVLAGTGTGLAPLWGILQDAIANGHRGPILLVHGGRTPAGLYLREPLRRLAEAHPNVTYMPCVLESQEPDVSVGRLDEVVAGLVPSPAGSQVFLCGDPDLVRQLKRRLYLAGAKLADLHADPFVNAPPDSGPQQRA